MSSQSHGFLQVMHVMRSYGAHGGEQQLAQYFAAEPKGEVQEAFVFVYRDPACAALFAARAPGLEQLELQSAPVATGSAWYELLCLLPRLPLLQWRLFRLLQRRRPDICVIQGFQAALVAWPAALLLTRLRWVYVHRITKSAGGSHPLLRLLYRHFDVMAGNSKSVTASLAPLADASRLVTLENGLDCAGFAARAAAGPSSPLPATDGPVLASVGRLLPHKGQALVIDAFERIAVRFPTAALWIAGDGVEYDRLQARAGRSPFASRIHLLGRRDDIPALLARASIFVNASSREGMSNAVLEAMAAGLPSVVVDAPGVTECHVDGATGFVVCADAEDIAAALLKILHDPAVASWMGEAARLRVSEHYSMEACRARYLRLFQSLAGRTPCAES